MINFSRLPLNYFPLSPVGQIQLPLLPRATTTSTYYAPEIHHDDISCGLHCRISIHGISPSLHLLRPGIRHSLQLHLPLTAYQLTALQIPSWQATLPLPHFLFLTKQRYSSHLPLSLSYLNKDYDLAFNTAFMAMPAPADANHTTPSAGPAMLVPAASFGAYPPGGPEVADISSWCPQATISSLPRENRHIPSNSLSSNLSGMVAATTEASAFPLSPSPA